MPVNGRANRLVHAVHQGVSSARRQLQKPADGIACDAGWQVVGAVGVLRHGFVDAEFARDGAPWCLGLELLGVLPQSLCRRDPGTAAPVAAVGLGLPSRRGRRREQRGSSRRPAGVAQPASPPCRRACAGREASRAASHAPAWRLGPAPAAAAPSPAVPSPSGWPAACAK
jgi:hypothetical protein